MAKYAFLSDEWMDAAKAIREEYKGKGAPAAHVVKMNQVITDVPFWYGSIAAHMDTGPAGLGTWRRHGPALTRWRGAA